MARTKKRDEVVQEARERFEYAQERWSSIYKLAREDMKFSDPTDPQQWPEQAIRERKAANRPAMTFDQTQQFVRQVVNQARRNRPSLKFMPVDDRSDPRMAEVLQGLARQTEYESRADTAYITALNHSTRGGIGYFRAVLEEVKGAEIAGQLCVKIVRVEDFESVLPDPDFAELDGADMQWCFVVQTLPRKRFEARYPKARAVSFDDQGWFTADSVRIVEYYRLAGDKVEHYKLTGEEILEESIFPSSSVPIFPVLGNEEWEDGKRRLSGCVRLARDAQITYNLERTAHIETVSMQPKAPYLAPVESIAGLESWWKQANSGNLSYLPYNTVDESGNPLPAKPERVMPPTLAAGWATLSEQSKADIQAALGQYEASIGNNPNQQSGRAVLALQDKADVGTYHYVDNLAAAISRCGRVLTEVWPVIYDQAQVVRIIGEDDEPQFVQIDPESPAPYAEVPALNGKQIVINPGVGRYDVRAVVGPAFATRQAEAAAEIGELVNGNPQMFSLLGDVYVKMRNMPEADKLAKRFKAMLPPQIQQAEQEEAPQIPPEVQAVLQQAQQEIQALRQALQEAQTGMAVEQMKLEAQKAMKAAELQVEMMKIEKQADASLDVAELKGLVDLLKTKMQPPPQLSSAVSEDMAEGQPEAM